MEYRTDIDMHGHRIKHAQIAMVLECREDDPKGADIGQMYFNTVSGTAKVFDGKDWIDMGGRSAIKWGDIKGDIKEQADLGAALSGAGDTAKWGDIKGKLASQTDVSEAILSARTAASWGGIGGEIGKQKDLTEALKGAGPRITLNGAETRTPDFYAPAEKGKKGETIVANDDGIPVWAKSAASWERIPVTVRSPTMTVDIKCWRMGEGPLQIIGTIMEGIDTGASAADVYIGGEMPTGTIPLMAINETDLSKPVRAMITAGQLIMVCDGYSKGDRIKVFGMMEAIR